MKSHRDASSIAVRPSITPTLPFCPLGSFSAALTPCETPPRCRPDEKGLDAAAAPIMEAFKVSYGGEKEDDVPAGGAKRPAGGAVREGDTCYDSST